MLDQRVKKKESILSKELQIYDVSIQKTENQILVNTPRLSIRSLRPDEIQKHACLSADPENVKLYRSGLPISQEDAFQELYDALNQWENGRNPLCQYSIYEKQSGLFIGGIGFTPLKEGKTEIFYLIDHKFWRKGFGREAVSAMVQFFIPEVIKRGYLNPNLLSQIYATAHPENIGSNKILTHIGFKTDGQIIHRFNNLRIAYTCEISDLCAQLQEKKCQEILLLNFQLLKLYQRFPFPFVEQIYNHFYYQCSPLLLHSPPDEQPSLVEHFDISELDLNLYRSAAALSQAKKFPFFQKPEPHEDANSNKTTSCISIVELEFLLGFAPKL